MSARNWIGPAVAALLIISIVSCSDDPQDDSFPSPRVHVDDSPTTAPPPPGAIRETASSATRESEVDPGSATSDAGPSTAARPASPWEAVHATYDTEGAYTERVGPVSRHKDFPSTMELTWARDSDELRLIGNKDDGSSFGVEIGLTDDQFDAAIRSIFLIFPVDGEVVTIGFIMRDPPPWLSLAKGDHRDVHATSGKHEVSFRLEALTTKSWRFELDSGRNADDVGFREASVVLAASSALPPWESIDLTLQVRRDDGQMGGTAALHRAN